MNVAILGGGAMGKVLAQMTEDKEGFRLAGIVEPLSGESLEALADRGGEPQKAGSGVDVVIDFSNPVNLPMVVKFCEKNNCPAVIATTGYEETQLQQIEALSNKVPVVFSANYSLGINIMKRILQETTPILEDSFDMEIVEKHHNKKLDAPSGTAKMLLAAIDGDGSYEHVFGRDGNRKRSREIGVHAVRGGTIAGEHTVIYAGDDEILEIKHTANSKKIFAAGALKAAAFAVEAARTGRPALYTMEDVLGF